MSSNFEKEGGAVTSHPSLYVHAPQSSPPQAPPLPPPLPVTSPAEKKRRVRSFFWKPIPEDRVKQKNKTNLWSSRDLLHIDIRAIEELFGHEDTPSFSTSSSAIGRRHAPITVLDSKRSLNISIFLKHLKKSSESLLEDLLHGNTGVFSVESLRELLKLLLEKDEVKNLHMFSGNPEDLAPPDAFIHKLIHVPRYEVRLEALLLKEEFFPSYAAMKHDMTVILRAIKELLSCEELHNVLHLVLQAGNIISGGGSAGMAVGFRLSSLLSLADTKANKPGINLLHCVALEAQKKDLLVFPEELQHVHQAARVCVDSIHNETDTLTTRIHRLQQKIQTDDELLTQLHSFFQSAAGALEDLRVSMDEVLREEEALIDFFCEDRDVFKLDECFRIFQNFCSKFKKAVQENAKRGTWEESQRKRLKESEDKQHSWAGHGGVGGVSGLQSNSEEADVAVALKRERFLELLKTSHHSPHPSAQHKRVTFEPCGSDTLVLPPIHSLSIINKTEEVKIQNESRSTQKPQNNNLQTKSQETSGNTEVTPSVTSDHSQTISVVEPEVIKIEPERKTKDKVQPTKETLKTSAGAKQTISKRTINSKTTASPSLKSPLSLTKAPSSSSSTPKCVSTSETASVRKLVPLRQDHSSSVQIQVRAGGSTLSRAKKTQTLRPEEKMCRVTLCTLDRPSPQTSMRNSMTKPLSFARNTVSSTKRHASAPGNQTKPASLRLPQVLKPTQTPTGTVRPPPPAGRPRKSSSAASESSASTRRSRDKSVKPTWR